MKFQRWLQAHTTAITIASALLIAVGYLGKWLGSTWGYAVPLMVASIIAAVPIAIHAYQALRVKVISIELLVTIAVIGAFAIGEYNESAIVTFLFLFGNFLEQKNARQDPCVHQVPHRLGAHYRGGVAAGWVNCRRGYR